MEVLKAHGTGNDFVVVVDLRDHVELSDDLVRALCDRRTGVGADGVIRIGAPHSGGHVFMDYRNADGSIVEMCGNGVRVVAKVVLDANLVGMPSQVLEVDTRDGIKPVTVTRDDQGRVALATVDMGPPRMDAIDIPVEVSTPDAFSLDIAPDVTFAAVSMGNPHAITQVDDVTVAPVDTLGPQVERHPAFPKGTNVEFAHVVARDRIQLRVWERGVGETQACGTGACATLVAMQAAGLVDDQATIVLPGGELVVRHRSDERPGVLLTGPAEVVARASIEPAWLAARGL
jgi:diaminopimelate epimerase